MKSCFHQSFIWVIALFLINNVGFTQTPILEAKRTAEVPPAWRGCDPKNTECSKSRLNEFIAANVIMPPAAKAQNAGGVVMVEFVVEKNGTIGEVRTLHDPGLGLGEEAIRVISQMAIQKIKWEPAVENKKRVPFRYMTPVSFNLSMPTKEAKEKAIETIYEPEVYDIADVMPRWAGCIVALTDTADCTFLHMIKHIQTNLKYPDSAFAIGASGPVVVEFVIDPHGNVVNPKVTKSLGHGCDEEAVRVISLMPAWQPGIQAGKPVSVKMVVPIMFQVPKPEKDE